MGCDIHTYVQVFNGKEWDFAACQFPSWEESKFTEEPFNWRSYSMFGFLANVRNYSNVPPILEENRGLPIDFLLPSDEHEFYNYDGHSGSWLLLSELINFDYDVKFTDKRDGSREISFREFLGSDFFRDIEIMKQLHPDPSYVRVVFFFDN